MRKNVLAMSIAALIGGLGLAGGASASVLGQGDRTASLLEVNTDGVGHILLVPYYTAQAGNATFLNLVNTDTSNGKVLKVRFRGAANSDDVFDFTLFLSPGDVWSGAVSQVNGRAALATTDNSCVLPQMAGSAASGNTAAVGFSSGTPLGFVTSRLGDAGIAGTLEGYVEVLNVADVPVNTATGSLYKAIKHVNGVAPCFSAAGYAALTGTTAPSLALNPQSDGEAAALGLANPSGGLFANWTIVNTASVSSWGGPATAVEARQNTGGPAGTGNIVFYPQVNDAVAEVELDNTADPLLDFNPGATTGFVTARQFDFPDLSTPYVTNGSLPTAAPAGNAAARQQADVLTAALAVTSVKNEYITSASVAGDTDWVFSLPTRRYHVALNYVTDTAIYGSTNYFDTTNTYVNTTRAALSGESVICVRLASSSLTYFDRSEQTITPDAPPFVISPSDPIVASAINLCGEAAVLSFNSDTSEVLSAKIGFNGVPVTYSNGWASIDTTNGGVGLPIVGAAFQKFLNQGSGGLLGNFGSVWPHRYTRPLLP